MFSLNLRLEVAIYQHLKGEKSSDLTLKNAIMQHTD